MTPLTSEEIRQFAENCGWTSEPCNRAHCSEHWISPDGIGGYMPAFDSDLNACFEALERFCKERDCGAEIHGGRWGVWSCHIGGNGVSGERSLQTAIIRAVNIAAQKKESEPRST